MNDYALDHLHRASFLEGAEDIVLVELARRTETVDATAGDAIVLKGELGSRMYFVVEGRMRVHDGEAVLAHLGPGDVFGEMAVLDREVRSASVTAETPASLLALEREAFYDVLTGHPEMFQVVIRSVLRREREIVDDVTTRSHKLMGYERELEIGRRIQQSFLPASHPSVAGLELGAHFEAAREVAGDFYDLFMMSDNRHVALVIGDVCDKGVGAALFMTLFRSLLRAASLFGLQSADRHGHEAGDVESRLLSAVRQTNDYVATTHRNSSMFASLFFGVLDPDSGRLVYANAGHEAPVVYRANGEVEQLDVTGGVIGLFPGAPLRSATTTLGPRDIMLAYTDGVNEARDADGTQFGEPRILELGVRPSENPEGVIGRLLEKIARFRGAAPPSDDITMICARRTAG